jgi:hypothetical protein
MQQRLASARVPLPALLVEQIVDVGIAPVGLAALRVNELGHAARGIARVTGDGEEQTA